MQDRLATNRRERRLAAGAEAPSLLAGLIFDADGARMTPTHAAKGKKRYRYYVSASLLTGGRVANSSGIRVPAGDIEGLVLDRLRQLLASRSELGAALAPLDLDAASFDAALNKASDLSQRWLATPPIDIAALVRRIVEKAQINVNDIALQLNRGELASALIGDDKAPYKRTDPMLLSIDATLKRAGKGKRLVIDNENAPEINQELVAMIVEAFSIRKQLFSGADDSIEAMTQRLGAGKGHLTALVRLSYLAPDIVRALLEGRQPIELTPTRLLRLSKDLPHDWREQRRFLGFVDRPSPAGDRNAP